MRVRAVPPRRLIACLSLLLSMGLLQACGGGDDSAAAGGGDGSDESLFSWAQNVYAPQCSLTGNYQYCERHYNAIAYFNGKCYQGDQTSCYYSQQIQVAYTVARISRGYY